jgi:triphosphoribosyl-dephospho-CoA synthetase
MTIPTAQEAASFRAAPIGLLKNTKVDKILLKPGKSRTIRNNYKAIKSASGGITIEDLEQIVEEFTEFANIGDGNLVAYGTRGTLSKLRNTIAADVNKDTFNRKQCAA